MPLIPYRKGKLLGFCLPDKTIVIEPQFEEIVPFINGAAKVKLKGKWGIIQEDGTYLIPPKYDYLDSNSIRQEVPGCDRMQHNGKWGLLIDNVEVFPPKYYIPVIRLEDGTFRLETKEKITVVNRDKTVISSQPKRINGINCQNITHTEEWCSVGNAVFNQKTKKQVEIPKEFDKVDSFLPRQQLFVGLKMGNDYRNLYGLFDVEGKTVLLPTYSSIWDHSFGANDRILFREKDEKNGHLDAKGQVVIPADYIEMEWVKDDLLLVKNDNGSAAYFINSKNEKVTPDFLPQNARIIKFDTFQKRFEYILDEKTYIYAEMDGKVLLSLPINELQAVDENVNFTNYAYLKTKTHTYILDHTYKTILKIDFPVEVVWDRGEYYFNHEKGGKLLAYNLQKKHDIPYHVVQSTDTFHVIKDEKGYGFMDYNEQILIPTGQYLYEPNQLSFDNLVAFYVLCDDRSYRYWVDVVQNIVYAEGLEDLRETPKNRVVIPDFMGKKYDSVPFKMPYFDDFEKDAHQTEYHAKVLVNGVNVGVSIALGERKLDEESRFLVRTALEKITEIDNLMLKLIKDDYKSKGNAKEYIEHYLREVDDAFINYLLENCNKKQSKQLQMLSIIRMKYFRIGLESYDRFIWLDYSLYRDGSFHNNNVLTMVFDQKGEMLRFCMES